MYIYVCICYTQTYGRWGNLKANRENKMCRIHAGKTHLSWFFLFPFPYYHIFMQAYARLMFIKSSKIIFLHYKNKEEIKKLFNLRMWIQLCDLALSNALKIDYFPLQIIVIMYMYISLAYNFLHIFLHIFLSEFT